MKDCTFDLLRAENKKMTATLFYAYQGLPGE